MDSQIQIALIGLGKPAPHSERGRSGGFGEYFVKELIQRCVIVLIFQPGDSISSLVPKNFELPHCIRIFRRGKFPADKNGYGREIVGRSQRLLRQSGIAGG